MGSTTAISIAIDQSQDVAALDAMLAKQSTTLDAPFAQIAEEQAMTWEDGSAMSTPAKRWFIGELLQESQTCESAALRQVRAHLSDLSCYRLCRALVSENPDEAARWPTFVLSVIGSPHQINVLGRDVAEQLERENGLELAIAALETLRRNASVPATHWLDHWANASTHSALRELAAEALASLAREGDMTREELAELATPTLRFSAAREIRVDCGEREFVVKLMGDGTLRYIDEDGAKLTSVPRARTMDDRALFRVGSRQMRVLKQRVGEIDEQAVSRLYEAMVQQREWPQDRWSALFVEHPILSTFGARLVWERVGSPRTLFTAHGRTRLVDCDGKTVTLAPSDRIRLAHPVTLEAAEISVWKKRIKGMEKPPFRQIMRARFTVEEFGSDWSIVARKVGALYSGPLQKRAKRAGYTATGLAGGEVGALTCQFGDYEFFVRHERYSPADAHEFGRVKLKQVAVRKGSAEVRPADLRETEYSEFVRHLSGFARKPR